MDDEGRLHAGVNLFAFHDLTKRIAVMQHQMGRRPLVFLHMTNANIVPMLSFGTLILDHEWRDQGDFRDKDFQERLSLDDDASLLLAESTGLQSGCLGIVHNLFHGDLRLMRSALGVALVHEMRMGVDGDAVGRRAGELMCNFGYGLPDCRVWRYWDDRPPLTTTGAAVKTLTLARQGKAMVVVASYGPGGEVVLDLDRQVAWRAGRCRRAGRRDRRRNCHGSAAGRFKLAMPRHDFRLILIESQTIR